MESMKKFRFAGLSLKSPLGLSSDNVILSGSFLEWLRQNNIGIIFTPTLTKTTIYLKDKRKRYAKINTLELTESDYIFVTRPLSLTVDELLNNHIGNLKEFHDANEDIKLVASIAGKKLNDIVNIVEKIEETKIFSAYEIDIVSTQILFNRRGIYEYAVDLIDEILSIVKKPLLAKIPVSMAINTEIMNDLLKTNINAIVISPHPIYSIGSHIFRVHSTAVSHVNINILAKVLTQFEEIDIAYIDDAFTFNKIQKPFIYKIFNVLLYDVSYLLYFKKGIQFFKKDLREFPVRWQSIRKDFNLLIDANYLDKCFKVCPFDAIPEKSKDNTIEVSEQCEFCGLCLSLCPKNAVKKAKIFSPI